MLFMLKVVIIVFVVCRKIVKNAVMKITVDIKLARVGMTV
jgi:hypothetical protein